MSAGEALVQAAMAALQAVDGIGMSNGPPIRAAFPHAVVEAGPEIDWGHKTGAGRELRLAVTIRDGGERPERLTRLCGEAEAALAGIGGTIGGWRLVSFVFLRSRIMAEGARGLAAQPPAWVGVVEFRGRLLSIL